MIWIFILILMFAIEAPGWMFLIWVAFLAIKFFAACALD